MPGFSPSVYLRHVGPAEREREGLQPGLHVPITLRCWEGVQCQHARHSSVSGNFKPVIYTELFCFSMILQTHPGVCAVMCLAQKVIHVGHIVGVLKCSLLFVCVSPS